MTLKMLLENVPIVRVSGSKEPDISALAYDSRKAGPGSLFAAIRGAQADGHDFIGNALEHGAAAIVAEAPVTSDCDASWVEVENSRHALSGIANAFFGEPSGKLKVAGITGTNGKTTTAFLLNHLLTCAWRRCGLVGTVRHEIAGERFEATHTTPESSDLQELLARMVDEDCRAAVMEVSSHGLAQGRVRDVEFDVGVFTNLSRDHLDYHGSMDDYFAAKRILFEQMARQTEKTEAMAVINGDDRYGQRLLRTFGERAVSYGVGAACDFRAVDARSDFKGTTFQLEAKGRSTLVRLPLIGHFNVYNALAALAAGSALGINFRESVTNLSGAPQVPGRLESVAEHTSFKVYVDYAHTPDALENALRTVRELRPARVITVFGCGGNRDVPKRAQMGAVSDELSDRSVITSDNPRKEDPGAIIANIEQGFRGDSFVSIEDRREAIDTAIRMARPNDIVLIAGKGHEATQTFADRTVPFDDREVAREVLAEIRSEGGGQ